MYDDTTTTTEKQPDVRSLMLALGERPLVIYPAYRRLVGGNWAAAAALAQLVYWWQAVGGRRYYKTDAELAAEVGLTVDEMRTVKRKLHELTFLTIKREGLPARTWYEFDAVAFANALADAGQPISTEHKLVQEDIVTDSKILQTSLGPTPQTSSWPAQQTNTEMTAESTNTLRTVVQGSLAVSAGRKLLVQQQQEKIPETTETEALQELERRKEVERRVRRRSRAQEAERRVMRALAGVGGRELADLFRQLTKDGLELSRWRVWIQAQLQPHLDRLGADVFGGLMREAVPAATGVREPRPYLVAVARRFEPPRGRAKQALEELDLDALLGPIEEG